MKSEVTTSFETYLHKSKKDKQELETRINKKWSNPWFTEKDSWEDRTNLWQIYNHEFIQHIIQGENIPTFEDCNSVDEITIIIELLKNFYFYWEHYYLTGCILLETERGKKVIKIILKAQERLEFMIIDNNLQKRL